MCVHVSGIHVATYMTECLHNFISLAYPRAMFLRKKPSFTALFQSRQLSTTVTPFLPFAKLIQAGDENIYATASESINYPVDKRLFLATRQMSAPPIPTQYQVIN